MPIDTKHPEYKESAPSWNKCKDFTGGEEAVKSAGTTYLPKLSGQTDPKYAAYKKRAIFYAAAARTVAGLVGAIFRKAPVIALPSKLEYLRKDATGTGMSLDEVAIRIITEIMITGRSGMIVDRPEKGGNSYISVYDAVDITNWSLEEDFVVLKENVLRSGEDKFDLEEHERYRELTLDEAGFYVVRLWTKDGGDKSNEWQYKEIQPLKNGRPISFIPFTCIAPSGLDYEIDRPPILDLVNVMEKHYQISADYTNALHVSALPTPYIAADISTDDNEVFNIGTDTAWVLPTGARAGFIEFTGQGLGPIEKALDKLENMLAALGARLIETKKVASVAETAEGIRTKESAATAILSQIVASVEAGMEKVLTWAAEAENAETSEISVKLNRELVQAPLDANMLNALTKSLQEGAVSPELFYHNIEEAGMATPDSTFDIEQGRIKVQKDIKKEEDRITMEEQAALQKASSDESNTGEDNT
jgi:hypothetical protein